MNTVHKLPLTSPCAGTGAKRREVGSGFPPPLSPGLIPRRRLLGPCRCAWTASTARGPLGPPSLPVSPSRAGRGLNVALPPSELCKPPRPATVPPGRTRRLVKQQWSEYSSAHASAPNASAVLLSPCVPSAEGGESGMRGSFRHSGKYMGVSAPPQLQNSANQPSHQATKPPSHQANKQTSLRTRQPATSKTSTPSPPTETSDYTKHCPELAAPVEPPVPAVGRKREANSDSHTPALSSQSAPAPSNSLFSPPGFLCQQPRNPVNPGFLFYRDQQPSNPRFFLSASQQPSEDVDHVGPSDPEPGRVQHFV